MKHPIPRVLRRPADPLFAWSAAGALALHALLLFATGPLQGGADLAPHLRLMQWMGEAPALRSVYAPGYHVAGALLAPWLGLSGAVKALAFAGAALLIGGFRCFQRAAGLPAASAALFAWAPYGFALSWCLPKVEAAGYGLAFIGLALLWQERPRLAALMLAATFFVHTAAALFLGLCGGILALARRDPRGLAALGVGCLLASPLLAAHWRAGCSVAQALLLSRGDYLRSVEGWSSLGLWRHLLALASPLALGCALAGAPALWRRHRPVAIVGAAVVLLYTNELWLAPLGQRTTLNLLRGLTILAFPVAAAAGVWLAPRPRLAVAVTAACALWAIGCVWWALPGSCHHAPVDWAQLERLGVDRCSFRWGIVTAPR